MKTIAIYGSTGTIGQNTLKVIQQTVGEFKISLLVAKSNYKLLAQQVNQLNPDYAVITDSSHLEDFKALIKTDTKILHGQEGLSDACQIKHDIVMMAILGIDAVSPLLSVIANTKRLLLANKESLVCASKFIKEELKKHNTELIPIDSEHNGLFQILPKSYERIRNVCLTASGGPFRKIPIESLEKVTISDAINHPNWKMGPKISVDSATLMNKGLEVIEAHHLFDIPYKQIDVIIHPQSIIHAIVNFTDGSSIFQASPPNMQVPISFGLYHPDRFSAGSNINLNEISHLNFEDVDEARYPCFALAMQAANSSIEDCIVLNTANEVIVDRFLNGEIKFISIAKLIEKCLAKFSAAKVISLRDLHQFNEEIKSFASMIN